jgi:hypothetical protein
MDRRHFLRTSCGMAAAFVAMNHVFGNLFDVSEAEAADPERAADRAKSLQGQFIFDDQTHFVHDKFEQKGLLGLAVFAAEHWNPALTTKEKTDLYYYKFENYVRQIFLNSDTSVALLSGAPFDDPSWWLLPNEQIIEAVTWSTNRRHAADAGPYRLDAGTTRLDGRRRPRHRQAPSR